jgi:16S rRNA (uracil1498-N3)-methyltransferase
MIALLVDRGQLATGASIRVPADEAHHLRVRRSKVGEEVRLLDGFGSAGIGVLSGPGVIEVREIRAIRRPSDLVLAVGAGDRERFGWLVEKAAELGVTDVIPLETDRTGGVAGRVRSQHVERLQRRASQAIKQSGAAWAPIVHLPHTLAELLARRPSGVRWLADPAGGPPAVPEPEALVLVVIGPEGGFAPAEHRLLVEAGILPVRLGPRVMRFETAAVAAATIAALRREVA